MKLLRKFTKIVLPWGNSSHLKFSVFHWRKRLWLTSNRRKHSQKLQST